jgi:hypothetical protein
VPVLGLLLAGQHRDWIGAEVGVERLHQPERSDGLGDIDMDPHGEGMDPGVGPPRSVERDALAGHGLHRRLDRRLHRRPMRLALEPHERGAVELEGEGEAGQVSRVPAETARPRSKSSTAIAGRPAR